MFVDCSTEQCETSRMFCVTLIAVASLACVEGLYKASVSNIRQHPYQAAVFHRHWDTSEYRYACSGAIVSQTHILTTASCTGTSFFGDLRVRVGSSYHQSGGNLHRVVDVSKHPNFTADFDSDIALIRLADELQLSRRVAIVKLPKQNEVLRSASGGSISSWDHTDGILESAVYLMIIDKCTSISNDKEYVTDNMICIKYETKPNNSPCCERDRGGPLVVAGTLYGLSSWSYDCGSSFPSVFTKVSSFTTWIEVFLKA